MADSIRLSGFGKDKKEKFCFEDPCGWVVAEVRKASKHWAQRWVITNTASYRDADADISLDEARKLHRLFKPKLLWDIEYNTECMESYKTSTLKHAAKLLADYTKYVEQLNAELETIESALGKDAGSFSHFHICIFEWDSGM